MHIKSIEISGFKSYKDAKSSEPFSPKINTVLGANGSGKSNFFHAIRFVLNDAFVNMRAEDRQSLLHEGAGHPVTSAFVEVVFDNSDGRFPLDREEVHLRRTIGKNKDEYHLDKKHINKSEVTNLLEGAGFSRANPYYIVQQGKIMALSTMKDAERLELLKEIGGTKMAVIEEKLSSLDAERKELAEYQQLDTKRRCLEYAMHDKELVTTRQQLEKVDEQHLRKREAASKAMQDVQKANSEGKAVDKVFHVVTSELEELARQKAKLTARKDELLAGCAKTDAEAKDLDARIARSNTLSGSAQGELDTLRTRIQETQTELDAAKSTASCPKAKMAKSTASSSEAKMADLRSQLDAAEQRLQLLFQKQGRNSQFKSAAERDAWVKSEKQGRDSQFKSAADRDAWVKSEKQGSNSQFDAAAKRDAWVKSEQEEQRLDGLYKSVTTLNSDLMDLAQSIGDKEAVLRKSDDAVSVADRQWAALRGERDQLQNQRNDAYRANNSELEGKTRSLEGELRKKRNTMENQVARDIIRGLQGLERLVNDHSVQLNTAVEVTAGNSLFHVVVEDAEVALKCTELLNSSKLGRISYPSEYGSDVMPLFKKIKCDQRFARAVQQVFGKTVLCRNMEIAGQCDQRFARAVQQVFGKTVLCRNMEIAGQCYQRVARAVQQEFGKTVLCRNMEIAGQRFARAVQQLFGKTVLCRNMEIAGQRFDRAVQQLFGKTVLCRNMEIAGQVARTADLNCVTIDGDQVSKRGALTGGFHDVSHSRLENLRQVKACGMQENLRQVKACGMQLAAAQQERRDVAATITAVDQEVARINGELGKVDMQRNQLRSQGQSDRAELAQMNADQRDKQKTADKSEAALT
eukprot:gene31778-6975_t